MYLELEEAALQRLLVHHPVVVLLCLQDACVHLTGQSHTNSQTDSLLGPIISHLVPFKH